MVSFVDVMWIKDFRGKGGQPAPAANSNPWGRLDLAAQHVLLPTIGTWKSSLPRPLPQYEVNERLERRAPSWRSAAAVPLVS